MVNAMTKYVALAAFAALVLVALNGRASATEGLMPAPACTDCDTPKQYDTQEVVKTHRDIDHSRVIDTTSYEGKPARIRSDVTLVNFVVHKYRVIESTELVSAGEAAPRRHRSCKHGGGYNRYDCGPLRARY
jgi:hypothetical protein